MRKGAGMQDDQIRLLDTVIFVVDMPERGVSAGDMATVVDTYADGMLEVEISDSDGRTICMFAVDAEHVARIDHEHT